MSLQKQASSLVMKQIAIATLFSTTFILGVVGLDANAQAQKDRFSCTNATLKGWYGVQGTGFRLTTQGNYVPFAAINLRYLDGNGKQSGTGITNVLTNFSDTNISGTYTVSPDCTVEFKSRTIEPDGTVRDIAQSGVIVDRGREIFTLQTFPTDNVQTGIFKKVSW